jgi:hypothetical protein
MVSLLPSPYSSALNPAPLRLSWQADIQATQTIARWTELSYQATRLYLNRGGLFRCTEPQLCASIRTAEAEKARAVLNARLR